MGMGCLVLAAKRAPLAGFVLALTTMCVLLPRYSPGAVRRLASVLAILAFPVLLLLPVLLVRAGADHRADYEERKNLTKVAWTMYREHPVAGVGIGTYDSVKRSYLPPGWSGWLSTVHNRYLLTLAETGTVGLASLLILFGMILATAYRGIQRIDPLYRPFQIALVAAMIAVFWEMAWDIFLDRQHGYLFWILTALVVIVPRALAKSPDPEPA